MSKKALFVSIISILIVILTIGSNGILKNSSWSSLRNIEKIANLDRESRINYINKDIDQTEKLILKNLPLIRDRYLEVLNDFFAVKIGTDGNLIVKNGREEMATFKNRDSILQYDFYVETNFLDDNSGIIKYTDKFSSGLYNYSNYLYRFDIKNNSIKISNFRIINIDENNSIEEFGQLYLQGNSAYYDTNIKKVHVPGMKPFSLYKCNEDHIYNIEGDKLILSKISIAKVCLDKGLDKFELNNKTENLMDRTYDYTIKETIYTTPKYIYDQALKI